MRRYVLRAWVVCWLILVWILLWGTFSAANILSGLAIALVITVLWLVRRLELIVVPVVLATIMAALLLPAVDFLDRRGAPRGGAVALVLLSGFAVLGGILTFVITQFIEGVPDV